MAGWYRRYFDDEEDGRQMERCEGHDSLVMTVSRAAEATEQHGRQLGKIFEMVREIKEAVDKNAVRAEGRDVALATLSETIQKIDHKIENGLRSEVRECATKIREMMGFLDARKKERVMAEVHSRQRFLRRGWDEFKGKAAFILVSSTIIVCAWLVVYILTRIKIFHEGPAGLLRLFGIGG